MLVDLWFIPILASKQTLWEPTLYCQLIPPHWPYGLSLVTPTGAPKTPPFQLYFCSDKTQRSCSGEQNFDWVATI